MILAMVPPIDSGDSSEDDEPEEIIELKGSKCESPLADEADENEIWKWKNGTNYIYVPKM